MSCWPSQQINFANLFVSILDTHTQQNKWKSPWNSSSCSELAEFSKLSLKCFFSHKKKIEKLSFKQAGSGTLMIAYTALEDFYLYCRHLHAVPGAPNREMEFVETYFALGWLSHTEKMGWKIMQSFLGIFEAFIIWL